MATFKHALLIDDDTISNFITKHLLLREEIASQVTNFLSAEDALSYLQQCAEKPIASFPDLIFLDLNMPGMSGWEFVEEYKKLPAIYKQSSRLYMLSSAIDTNDILQAKSIAEIEDFISKPLSQADITLIRKPTF